MPQCNHRPLPSFLGPSRDDPNCLPRKKGGEGCSKAKKRSMLGLVAFSAREGVFLVCVGRSVAIAAAGRVSWRRAALSFCGINLGGGWCAPRPGGEGAQKGEKGKYILASASGCVRMYITLRTDFTPPLASHRLLQSKWRSSIESGTYCRSLASLSPPRFHISFYILKKSAEEKKTISASCFSFLSWFLGSKNGGRVFLKEIQYLAIFPLPPLPFSSSGIMNMVNVHSSFELFKKYICEKTQEFLFHFPFPTTLVGEGIGRGYCGGAPSSSSILLLPFCHHRHRFLLLLPLLSLFGSSALSAVRHTTDQPNVEASSPPFFSHKTALVEGRSFPSVFFLLLEEGGRNDAATGALTPFSLPKKKSLRDPHEERNNGHHAKPSRS